MNQLSERYLEDFAVGQTFSSGRLRIEGKRIRAFAAEFDPQPFHLDEAAARRSFFGELTASGWYTAAVSMRLLMETGLKPAGGYIGAGADGFRWPRPVRPGDEPHVECEVIEVGPSHSRPDRGLIKVRMITLNQDDEARHHGAHRQLPYPGPTHPQRPALTQRSLSPDEAQWVSCKGK